MIVEAQQIELERLGTNEEALKNWKRETSRIRDMLHKIDQ